MMAQEARQKNKKSLCDAQISLALSEGLTHNCRQQDANELPSKRFLRLDPCLLHPSFFGVDLTRLPEPRFSCLPYRLLRKFLAEKRRSKCRSQPHRPLWLNGKMVLAVLFEVLLSKLDFSPCARGNMNSIACGEKCLSSPS
jgi:hypothetical protein